MLCGASRSKNHTVKTVTVILAANDGAVLFSLATSGYYLAYVTSYSGHF